MCLLLLGAGGAAATLHDPAEQPRVCRRAGRRGRGLDPAQLATEVLAAYRAARLRRKHPPHGDLQATDGIASSRDTHRLLALTSTSGHGSPPIEDPPPPLAELRAARRPAVAVGAKSSTQRGRAPLTAAAGRLRTRLREVGEEEPQFPLRGSTTAPPRCRFASLTKPAGGRRTRGCGTSRVWRRPTPQYAHWCLALRLPDPTLGQTGAVHSRTRLDVEPKLARVPLPVRRCSS